MRTFTIQTLGCKVNQYESEQIATLLRARGLVPSSSPERADLRVINTCSVTIQAASKSRQTIRRSTRLKVLDCLQNPPSAILASHYPPSGSSPEDDGDERGRSNIPGSTSDPRVVVVGCWATSDKAQAQRLKGVDAVIGHHDDVHAELNGLLDQWIATNRKDTTGETRTTDDCSTPQHWRNELWDKRAGAAALQPSANNKPQALPKVKKNPSAGTHSLPLLGEQRQTGHQRAFLKIQDGCDAHCTYCIIPRLRPELWSKPVEMVVDEARRLVDCGHVELVLTGIFLGAYGQPTAIHKRQPQQDHTPLSKLVQALCGEVPGLRRLRLSSLEPGDLTGELISELKSHPQVVPHFHLPLQSGSDDILRRMNRQYTRYDFLRMIEQVNLAFDRPAITTDIIVGFPGETDREFEQTLDVVDRAGFIHIHAFSFSPRPGTAAARWKGDFVHGPVVNQRIEMLERRAREHGFAFRKQFIGESVELLVERQREFDTLRHGRSERYFDVWFEDATAAAGDLVSVAIDRVTPQRTFGDVAHSSGINSHRMM